VSGGIISSLVCVTPDTLFGTSSHQYEKQKTEIMAQKIKAGTRLKGTRGTERYQTNKNPVPKRR